MNKIAHPSQRMPAVVSFVQAARQGSFAAAARMQDVSAAAVSKNVASLESALGVRLMNRTTRSLQLTPEGKAFLEQVSVAMDALDSAMDSIGSQRKQVAGSVRISTSNAFGMDYLMPLLPDLTKRHPALRLEVDFDDRKVDLVKDGYDLALRGGQMEDSSLVSRKICTMQTVLVASTSFLQKHGVPKVPADLAGLPQVAVRFFTGCTSSWTLLDSAGKPYDYVPHLPAVVVSAPDAAVSAAVLGLGVAQVAVHHAWKHLKAGRLKIVLHKHHASGSREMALQYPHRALLAPRVRATVEYLLESLAHNEALHVNMTQLKTYRA